TPMAKKGMDAAVDFPRAEKRRRHCWRERVGNAGASFVREAPASSGAFPWGRGINGLLYAGEKATRRRDGFAGRCRRKREKGKGFGGPQGPRGIGLRRRP